MCIFFVCVCIFDIAAIIGTLFLGMIVLLVCMGFPNVKNIKPPLIK